jgi:broad specificity phosphatase PhoE
VQILLVRHGQASWGAADYDVLSATGEQQSRVLGAALAARGTLPDVLVSGAMRRHRQTAACLLEGAGWSTVVVEDQGWDEFDHRELLELHPAGPGGRLEEATLRWSGGEFAEEYDESFADFCARVDAALRRTAHRIGPRQTAVVVTSGGPVSWVAASLLDGGAPLWTRLNPVIVNTSVTKVVVGRRGSTLVSFNDHGHLEGTGLVSYR